jgi:hypothetical protein
MKCILGNVGIFSSVFAICRLFINFVFQHFLLSVYQFFMRHTDPVLQNIFTNCRQLARYMNIRKFLVAFVVKYVVDLNSSIWFDQDHLCYCVVSSEEELTDLWYLVCDSPGESVAFVLVPNWSWPASLWICIHCVNLKLLCVLSVWVIVCVIFSFLTCGTNFVTFIHG